MRPNQPFPITPPRPVSAWVQAVRFAVFSAILILGSIPITAQPTTEPGDYSAVTLEQITFGPMHHFFGYIGQCRTIPWNASGRYILCLRTSFQDHMPAPDEHADVVLLDAHNKYAETKVDETRGWNPQQGTMYYWNPASPETQFFFNDRDPETGKIFCVLYDISGGLPGKRLREYRFEDTPVGNSGVAQNGGFFLAINYARLARLRLVTGYPGAFDWTVDEKHPEDDGIFKVNIESGSKTLLISYRQIRDALIEKRPDVADKALFINHTLWSRDDSHIYFYARAEFETKTRIDVPFTIRADGTDLKPLTQFIGGHPEWETGTTLIGSSENRQVIYDVPTGEISRVLGDNTLFPKPGGDISLSPDSNWLVNGYGQGGKNRYVFFPMNGGPVLPGGPINQGGYEKGETRIDPAPAWNRESNAIVVPGIADDESKSRQMFLMRLE